MQSYGWSAPILQRTDLQPLPPESGPGALHFPRDLPDDFFAQCVAERKVTRYVKGFKRIEWVKGKAERNEALDLLVYSLAMAHYLGLHRYGEHDWARLKMPWRKPVCSTTPVMQKPPWPSG